MPYQLAQGVAQPRPYSRLRIIRNPRMQRSSEADWTFPRKRAGLFRNASGWA